MTTSWHRPLLPLLRRPPFQVSAPVPALRSSRATTFASMGIQTSREAPPTMQTTPPRAALEDRLRPAARVSGQRQDVWSIINEAAAASPYQPIVNLGQGFFGYNPPAFILDAAKEALDRVDCNQYSPPTGRPRLKKALAEAYRPFWGRALDPDTEIVVTTGANEGILSACMAFVEPGDEVIVFEPFFDQYIFNIKLAGGRVVYVPMYPPRPGGDRVTSSADWVIDFAALERAFSARTRMIILNTPHNPVGKVYSPEELRRIADLCVKHHTIILSDEVYDRLHYIPFTRIATLSPEVERLTLTVGSAGKNFYATGWRVGWLMGPANLIKHVATAHRHICFCTVSPLQEACAAGFEQAEANGFWDATVAETKAKMARFNAIWDELGIAYSEPEGGYFVMADLSRVRIPEGYQFPEKVASRPHDFRLAYWMIQELGVAAIPTSEFYTEANASVAENYLRFAVCKPDEVLDEAKTRLRALKQYLA